MRGQTSADLLDIDAFKQWKPEAQRKALELLESQANEDWKPFYCLNPRCDGNPHGTDWNFQHARVDQRPPQWDANWLTWLISSGRGAGKTYTGSNVINRASNIVPLIGLLGATGPDLRETMVEGESGILATAPPGKKPTWNPSRKRLVYPNGCVVQGFSGEEPDRIRGKNMGMFWVDEPAHIDLIDQCWKQLKLTLRAKGKRPHIIATTTPKPTKWMKELIAHPRTITTRVSTYTNLVNLNDEFRATILEEFEGTRFGRQELHGELLEDVEGSLWKNHMLKSVKDFDATTLTRIVVAVDPAGSAHAKSDETGIIVVGILGDNFYVLADYTGKYSPAGWANRATAAYDEWSADKIVAEKNYGGDMVKHTLESTGSDANVVLVDSRRGKQLRADPVVGLYEKGRVYHVSGENRSDLLDLEDEMTSWVPGEGASPNRVDALVHGITHLNRNNGPASIGRPGAVLKGMRSPHNSFLSGSNR